MCSTPPVRAPKSQLTGEQPLTGRHLNSPQKTILLSKIKRYHNDKVGGNNDKIKPHTSKCGQPTKLKTIKPQDFAHCCEGSEPPVHVSVRGTLKELRIPRIWLWRLMESGFQYFLGTRGNRDYLRAHTILCVHQDPGEKSHDPAGDWTKPTC